MAKMPKICKFILMASLKQFVRSLVSYKERRELNTVYTIFKLNVENDEDLISVQSSLKFFITMNYVDWNIKTLAIYRLI